METVPETPARAQRRSKRGGLSFRAVRWPGDPRMRTYGDITENIPWALRQGPLPQKKSIDGTIATILALITAVGIGAYIYGGIGRKRLINGSAQEKPPAAEIYSTPKNHQFYHSGR